MSRIITNDYAMELCNKLALRSRCYSRKIGVIIVRDGLVLSGGYNTAPEELPSCNHILDDLHNLPRQSKAECPRHVLGYKTGSGLHICPAIHAEAMAIAKAARIGITLAGTTLYINTCIPCAECMKLITLSGISNVVVKELELYGGQVLSAYLALKANISVMDINGNSLRDNIKAVTNLNF